MRALKENTIDKAEKYNAFFPDSDSNSQEEDRKADNKKRLALEHALDIRKFEIEMYWKRATYFWTFIGATLAGFFLLISRMDLDKRNSTDGIILLALCSLGFIFTYCWYLVNRGSKFWQNNWERHVDMLEDEIIGPLYKTAINMQSSEFWKLHKEYPYSVSKINQLLSLFLVFTWIVFGIWASIYFDLFDKQNLIAYALCLITFIFVLIVSFLGLSELNLQEKDNREIFVKRNNFLK